MYDLSPAPKVSGFIAQLVRVSQRYREATGSNPIKVLTFTGFHKRNCINCFHNCEDQSLLDFTSALQFMKYFTYIFTFIPHALLRTNKWPAPNVSWLERRTGITRSRVQTPLKCWLFAGFYIRNCINCFITARIIAYLISHVQFNIWNISHLTSHSFLTDSLGTTNDQLPTSVAS